MATATVQVGAEQRRCTPFTVSNDLLDRPSDLRARALEDGYLFIRALVPDEPIVRLRRDIAAILDGAQRVDLGRRDDRHPARDQADR